MLSDLGPELFRSRPQSLRTLYTAVLAVAIYNCLELVLLIFMTFSKYEGLYFWSLLLATVPGVLTDAVFLLMYYYMQLPAAIAFAFASIGWCFMITGQALVLYSRLHMVLHSRLGLRLVLAMIIFSAIFLHIPDVVTGFGAIVNNPARHEFIRAFHIMEKIQLTGFSVQQFILSGLYLYLATNLLSFVSAKARRKELHRLIAMNVAIIVMDVTLVVFVYLNWWVAHESLKPFVYSIKLKLEFAVLRTLVSMSKSASTNLPDFVDPDRIQGDVRYAPSIPMSRVQRHRQQHLTDSMISEEIGWDQTSTAHTTSSTSERFIAPERAEDETPLQSNNMYVFNKRSKTYP
ncbi:integral membrane protein [Nannizzia gypsea CBS 118893]|uniref:Integral membrane protein n=1 Tax=Arthroderma gypseum (strain ATCC MYA-4604 / CBS 118893) TaxID=535722 RepID=E4V3L0_ARTGP|nr:integral membrane protein [Nannizzia gypsea CBS 118893]EFR04584.1 integral membrane protein [Nannizzia gypsea CBS 118893]